VEMILAKGLAEEVVEIVGRHCKCSRRRLVSAADCARFGTREEVGSLRFDPVCGRDWSRCLRAMMIAHSGPGQDRKCRKSWNSPMMPTTMQWSDSVQPSSRPSASGAADVAYKTFPRCARRDRM